jgi:hypothetical protein
MGWPMFWFHLFMPNSTSNGLVVWNERRSELFLYNRDFIYTDTSLFLDKKIGFRKMISQFSICLLIVPIFKEKRQNVFWYCFRAIFNSSIFLAFIDFVDDGNCWYLYKWYFCTKKMVNLEKNSIYKLRTIQIRYQEEIRISKAGQFLRKYKLDNYRRCLMFWKVKWYCGPRPDLQVIMICWKENRKILELKGA